MRKLIVSHVLFVYISLTLGCTDDKVIQQDLTPLLTTGAIQGNISPINVYDAEVAVLQSGQVINVTGVQDGVFQIDNLPPGRYDLRVSALAYVTNDAIRGIEVVGGQITEAGRAVIFPQDTGGFIPTRITGRVYEAVTGAPIADAAIKVECNEGICSTLEGISDPEGQFEIAVWANLTSIVTVTKQGYQSARAEVVGIPTGKSESIEINLKKMITP